MDATKTLSFTSAEYHMLKLAARGEGKKPEEFLASLLTRFFRAMADLQGIECPVTVTPEHIHRPGLTTATRQPAEEEPAVLTALDLPATPTAQPELALGYELPPPPPSAGAHGILARAAKLNQTQV